MSKPLNSPIVQPVEHLTVNQGVVGSSPTRGATWPVGQAVKTPPFHGGIGGSIPPPVTIRALSSAGRASALQAECQRFDPVSAHHVNLALHENGVLFLFSMVRLQELLVKNTPASFFYAKNII